MNLSRKIFFLACFIILSALLNFFLFSWPTESASSIITATVAVGMCGNNFVEHGEDCDGSALDGQTCQSLGYDTGTLSCDISCSFNVSDCANLGPDEGSAVLSGTAYPMSVVKILKDGQIAATTASDSSGHFNVTLSDLIVGTYSFAVYAYDSNGNKSKTLTYTREISKNETETISGIIIPPTLSVDNISIKKGDKVNFSGQSAPGATVAIGMVSDGGDTWSFNATAGVNGYYSYALDTGDYNKHDYVAAAKTNIGGSESEYSNEVSFKITDENVGSENASECSTKEGDLNCDERVNLIDFSILIHWFDQPNFPSKVDINTDKKVNLSDFSVMMYNWSG